MKHFSVLRSPFSVLRSPFSVLRSPFSVLRLILLSFHRLPFCLLCITNISQISGNIQAQELFTLDVTPDILNPIGYCDVITFTIRIKNTGSSSAFDGEVKFYFSEWDLIDYSDLPGATLDDNSPDYSFIYFTTPTLSTNQIAEYKYQMVVRPFYSYGFHTENTVKRLANNSAFMVNGSVTAAVYKPVPYPYYTSYYASDLIDDHYDGGTYLGPLVIFPVTPQPGSMNYAGNTSLSQRIYVEDELVFDIPSYTFYNGQNNGGILVNEGGTIKVLSGSFLLIDGMTITSCNAMWKGFYVEAGGGLELRNCTIENAQYGIQAERGATVTSYGSTFLNNYIGLYIPPYTYQPDPENPQNSYIHLNGFSANTFLTDGTLLPGYDGQSPTPGLKTYAGIHATNLSSLIIPGSVISTYNGTANAFINLYNGIIAKNTSLFVGDAFFVDIVRNPELPLKIQGYGIYIEDGKHAEISGNMTGQFQSYSHHFENVSVGIENSKGSIEVYGMTMYDVGQGIVVKNAKNRVLNFSENTIFGREKGIVINHCVPIGGNITYNEININGAAFADNASCIAINDLPIPTRWNVEFNNLTLGDGFLGIYNSSGQEIAIRNNTVLLEHHSTEYKVGIYLNGTKSAQVTCNDLTGDFEEENIRKSFGIYASSADMFDVSCNMVDYFTYGINFAGSNTASRLRGNTFGIPDWDGLVLGRYPDDGNAVIGWQEHQGNIWEGTESDYTHYSATHLTGNTEILDLSLFFIDTGTNSEFEPPSIHSVDDWFRDLDDLGGSFTCEYEELCPEGIGYNPITPVWDSLDLRLVEGNLGYVYFDNPLSWTGRFQLYHRLHDEAALYPQPIEDFLEDQESLNIGQFSRAYDSLSTAIRYNGNLQDILTEYPDELNGWFYEINFLDSLLNEDRGNDSLSDLITLKMDSIAIKDANYHVKDSIIQAVVQAKLTDVMDDIENIAPDSIWEEKLQFTLLESALLAKNDTLTSSTDLYDLAINCPDLYSDAVYIARSLVRSDSTILKYDDGDLCTKLYPRSGLVNSFSSLLALSPNPANESIRIHYPGYISKIQIFDMIGNSYPVYRKTFDDYTDLRVGHLLPGAYFVSCETMNGKYFTAKFIISQ